MLIRNKTEMMGISRYGGDKMTLYETLMKNCLASYKPCTVPCTKAGCTKSCITSESKNCVDCLHNKFTNWSNEFKLRPYDCEAMTMAYMLRYCNKYASEILTALYQCPWLLCSDSLNVVSIGCGPGTELLALERYAKQSNYAGNINYTGFDKDKGWGYAQGVLTRTLFEYDPNTKIHPHWIMGSLTADNGLLPTTNLLILNYVVSDVYKRGDITAFFINLTSIVNALQHGACVIINDANSRNMGRDQIDQWCKSMVDNGVYSANGYVFCQTSTKYQMHGSNMRFFNIPNTVLPITSLQTDNVFDATVFECRSAFAVLCKL